MDLETRRDLELLEAVAADGRVTQRKLSNRLGIALGLTNLYLKRLIRKGYVKVVNVKPNRILYLITPQGIAEKTRLTYIYMDYSLRLYKEVRRHLREVLEPLANNSESKIAIFGTGEAAELAYLSLKELGLEPIAIYGDPDGGKFLGMTVQRLKPGNLPEFDYLLVASLENPKELLGTDYFREVSADKILFLRP